MPVIVKCTFCGKEKRIKPSKLKKCKDFFCNHSCKANFQKGKPTWNKGLTLPLHTPEHNDKIRQSCKKNQKMRLTQFQKGCKWTDETKQKRRESLKHSGALNGENNPMFGKTGALNPNWQGGTSYWRKEYFNSIPYKQWRSAVFKSDGYKCQICGVGHTRQNVIHAHHIKSFVRYPLLRLDTDNGMTLCKHCHELVHSKKFSVGKIISVERMTKKENMIDIEVDRNNNFFANGILVHNSATPYREDGRTNYIFALTGYPTGLDWGSLMKILGKHYHDINVYIVGSEQAKINLTSNLLNREQKTIIFVNELAIGNKIADSIGIPFIHGQTRNRMELARESKVFVASRVMELGVSLKDLEHIIEVDFLFGSRREEVQRTGRLLHSEKADKHDIIMTKDEFEKYGKRLHGLIEKGFRINLKPMVSGSFRLIRQETEKRKGKNGSVSYDLVEELYDEGFFRTEKTFAEVCGQLEKRGMTAMRQKKAGIFGKLNNMVSGKKLFKDTKNGKKVFVMR